MVAFGGEVFQDTDFGLTITEVFGVLFAGVVLLITFGSLLSAGLPLLTALIGVGAAFGGISIVAAFAPVSSTAPMLAVMIGLAVGIDYALFILSRHRTQLARGQDPEESAAEAVATAGGAVVFAGLTVIIALLGLLVVGIPFLSVMGVAAAFAVFIAVIGAVTLLPALLGVLGRRLTPKPKSRAHRRANADDDGAKRTMGRRWVDLVLKAPVVFVVLVVGLLGAAAVPALSLDLNLPSGGADTSESSDANANDLIADGFGPGYNGPLIVTVDITQTTDIFDDLDAIGARLGELDDVAYVGQGAAERDGRHRDHPGRARERARTRPRRRRSSSRSASSRPTSRPTTARPIAVTGYTAVAIDISNRLTDALVPFALIVVGLSIVLLLIVFRSVFVPIKAALGFLLSAFGALGVTVAIFQWGWFADFLHVEPGPILSFLPILLMAVLFGLAMDYEVFLVSGMREEFVKTRQPRSSIVHGFQHAARVVTAAALIMFFVFFAFVPEGSGAIKGIAFALAIGVAFDAFLVRMTLVPAAMALAGRARLVAAEVAREAPARRRHRGRGPARPPRAGGLGRRPPRRRERRGRGLRPARAPDRPDRGRGAHRRRARRARRVRRPPGRRGDARRSPRARSPVASPCSACRCPSGAGTVMRGVAIAEVAADAATGGTVGELVARRADATRPWYRLAPSNALVRTWVGRAADAAGHGPDGTALHRRHPALRARRRGPHARGRRRGARRAAEGRRRRPRRRPGRLERRAVAGARAPRPGLGDAHRGPGRVGRRSRRLARTRRTRHPHPRTRLHHEGGRPMSTRLSRLFGSTPAERRVRYGVLVAAVIAVPLAVAGLVSGAFARRDRRTSSRSRPSS